MENTTKGNLALVLDFEILVILFKFLYTSHLNDMIVLFLLKALLVHFIQTPTFGLSFLLLLSVHLLFVFL